MLPYKCTSRDRLGTLIETSHAALDLAIYEAARRKAAGHTECTAASVDNATPPIAINPGDVVERHSRPRIKKQRSSRGGNKLSVMEALSGR